MRGADETPCSEPGRLAVPLLLDEREILGHIVKSLKDRRQGNLIVPRCKGHASRRHAHAWLTAL